MTKKKMLTGSLSNDLLRVANLTQRGSHRAAQRFFQEVQKWADELYAYHCATYIHTIIKDIKSESNTVLSVEKAEKFLMYSVLLQNYSLKLK